MGLTSWIQNVLAGKNAQTRKTRSAREDFVQLFLTRLEDRRVLNADFALVDGDPGVTGDSLLLDNFTQATDENLTIVDTGAAYQFILSEGQWNGTDGGGVTGNGLDTLTVDKASINDLIQIDDSAAIDVDILVGPGTVDFTGLTGGLEIGTTDRVGDISQDVASEFLVSSLDVNANSLTLDNADNDFGSVTVDVTTSATLRDANDITLGLVSTGGNIQITALNAGIITLNGNINTDSATNGGNVLLDGDVVLGNDVAIDTDAAGTDGTFTVTGSIDGDGQILSINVGTNDLSLTNAANDFGTLLVTANNATIVDADDIQLGASTLAGNLNVTAGGAITEAATPGIISTGGNLVLSANGDIGATSSGALDVRVTGTASLTATGSDIFISSDQSLTIDHLETAAAQADTVNITTTGAANLTLQVLAAEFVNLETDLVTLTVENGLLAIQGDTLTAGSITLVVTGLGSVLLGTSLQTDGGNIDLQNAAQVTLGNSIILDTEFGNNNDAGDVLFSAATGAAINATTSGMEGLSINTTSTGGNDGNVNLSDIGTGVRLGTLSVIAGDGTITLNDTSGVANLAEVLTDAGTVTFGSFTQLTADTLVQTLGGDVNWQNTTVFSDANGPHNLTIDTDGGNVQLGRFTNTDGNVAGTFVNDLVIDTTDITAGTLMLHGDITLANNFQYTGGAATFLNAANSALAINASILTQATGTVQVLATSGVARDIVMQDGTTITTTNGNVTLEATGNVLLSRIIVGGINTASITAGGSISDNTAADDDGNESITANMVRLVAGTGIGDGITGDAGDIDTLAGTLAAQTTTGDINIDETDALTIGTVGGLSGVTVDAAVAGDEISITAGGALTVSQAVTIDAPGNITLSGPSVTINNATVEIDDVGFDDTTITATNPRNGVVEGTGIISINATTVIALMGTATVRTDGGVIQFTTDDILIDATAVIESSQANNGVVIIRNASANRDIELGGNDGNADLNISDAELDRISAESLRIGRLDNIANAGNINITDTFSAIPASLLIVQLFAAGNVTQSVNAGISAGSIGIEVNGSITLGSALNNAINAFAALAGGSILFNDANSLTVTSIADAVDNALVNDGEAGISGVTSTTSFVDLRTVNGNLTITDILGDPIEVSAAGVNPVNNLAINFLAAGLETFININTGANVTSLAGAHRYTADNMAIAGTITASTTDFSVSLRNANANVAINLGSLVDNTANTLELSAVELNNITTNLLAIGRNTGNVSGNITISNVVSPANTQTLHLITPGTVTDAANGALVETNLLIEAAGGAMLDNLASHDVDVLAAIITNPGASLTFRDLDDLTVGTVDRLTVTNDANETVGLGTISGITTNGRSVGNLGGDVLLISETGGVVVDQPITTTATTLGRNSGSITINALGTGDIVLNANLVTQGTTIGGNGMGGDITLTTANGSLNINAANLQATGGGLAADGGNITLDANGQNADVLITGDLVTNDVVDATVRGNITIAADDSVTIDGSLSTTGLGTVTITANDSALDGDGNGLLTMNAGSSITAAMGLVTLQTVADAVDEASITVEQITTTNGNVLIDANGINADVLLRNTISTVNGNVTVQADDSVSFQATGMILVSGIGNVLVRGNENISDGDGNDEILMADGSLISTNTGTITLRTDGANGGSITLGQLVTQSTTNAAVTINANAAVLDGGDTGGADIVAIADPATRVNIIAGGGVGPGNAIETMARRFDVQNFGATDVNIDNTTTNLDVVIERMTTLGGNITFNNQSGTGLLTIGDLLIPTARISSGDAGTNVNGGDITINTSADLLVIAPISSRDGRGGTFTLTGGAIFDAGASIQLGAGDINITTGSLDILFNVTLIIDNGPANFLAPRDIIVGNGIAPEVVLLSRVDDGNGTDTFVDATTVAVMNGSSIDSHITLRADNNGDGFGGVLVRRFGQVVASGNLTLEGSDLIADGLVFTTLPGGIQNGVHIEADAANQVQLLASGDLTLQNRPLIVGADIVIGGRFGTQTATAGPSLNVLIDANDNIYLANNTTVFSPANVSFGDVVGRDPVIDDGSNLTPSNLTVNSGGITTFFGRVGDNPAMPATAPDRIDSLTTDAGGETRIRGGIVSTLGAQTYNDGVLINADTIQFGNTTFTAGGDVNFFSAFQGLDLGTDNEGGVIQDDVVLNITGKTTFAGFVGGNSATSPLRIGDGIGRAITVNSTGETFFNNLVFTQSGMLQAESAGRITFLADVKIDAGNIGSDFLANVTFDSLAFFSNGELTFGTMGMPNADELFIFVGSRIDTSLLGKNVTINSRVTDPVANMVTQNEDFILTLGGGDLVINGNVGSGANRFGALVVGSANDIDANSAIMTDGVRVVFDASGNITMPEGMLGAAIIDTNNAITGIGGPVLLQAVGNVTVSQILSTAGFVALTSTGGAIMDAGDFNGLNDLQTAQLRLVAATGIGDAGNAVLETQVSNLAAMNTGSQRILVSNTGPLVIGGVPFVVISSFQSAGDNLVPNNIALPVLAGMQNQNGDIGLTNIGNLTAPGGTIVQTTNGTVGLFVQGNAVFAGQVRAINNEHIFVDVSGDFTLMNGQAAADFQTDGNGKIIVTADGVVNINPNSGAVVQSGTGTVIQPRPLVPLQLISTPQVSTEGIAVLTFTVGLPGETNFQVIIDWGDGGPLEIQSFDAGQHTITHDFDGPPDANNPGAPIRIFLVVMTDPNIHFFGNNLSTPLPAGSASLISLQPGAVGVLPQPAPANGQLGSFLFPVQQVVSIVDFVDRAINPLNFNNVSLPNALQFITQSLDSLGTFANPAAVFNGNPFLVNLDDLGVVSVVPAFQVPTTGFGGASIIEPNEIPPFFVPGSTATALPDDSEDFDDDSEDLEFSGGSAEEKGQDEIIVRLRVLSPSGQKLFEYEIEAKYLSNPLPLWSRLSDGRYQIVIEEPGSAVPIVVRDVELRDHKVIRTFDRNRRDNDSEARRETRPDDTAVSFEEWGLPETWDDVFAPESDEAALPEVEPGPDAVWEHWQPTHSGSRLSRQLAEPEESDANTPQTSAALVGGLALAALGGRSLKNGDSPISGFSKRLLSPAARLRRRLRK